MIHLMMIKTNYHKKTKNSIIIIIIGHFLIIYRKEISAFDIDSKVKDGRLALMYRGNNNKPQIWF